MPFPCLRTLPERLSEISKHPRILGAIICKDRDLPQDTCIWHLSSEKGRRFSHRRVHVSCFESSRSWLFWILLQGAFHFPWSLHKGQTLRFKHCSVACVGVNVVTSGCSSFVVQRRNRARWCGRILHHTHQPLLVRGRTELRWFFSFIFLHSKWGEVCSWARTVKKGK